VHGERKWCSWQMCIARLRFMDLHGSSWESAFGHILYAHSIRTFWFEDGDNASEISFLINTSTISAGENLWENDEKMMKKWWKKDEKRYTKVYLLVSWELKKVATENEVSTRLCCRRGRFGKQLSPGQLAARSSAARKAFSYTIPRSNKIHCNYVVTML
jgi:hypothetical protein